MWLCFLLKSRDPRAQKVTNIVTKAWAGQFFELTEGQLGNHAAGANSMPIPFMYGIFTYIYHKHQPNIYVNMPYMDDMGWNFNYV